MLVFGIDGLAQLSVRVEGPWDDVLPNDCIARAMDLPSLASPGRIADKEIAHVEVPIEVPLP